MTESSDPELTTAALGRGARGVILKSADADALAPALRAVIRGESLQPEPPDAPRAPKAIGLTPREEAVLQALGRGLTNAEIAGELSITRETVRFHLVRAYDKLGVSTRLEAIRALVSRATFGNPTTGCSNPHAPGWRLRSRLKRNALIQPGEIIWTGDGRKLGVVDKLPIAEADAPFVGLLRVEESD